MLSSRYRKLTGMHRGHIYQVAAPYGEIETPMRWVLHCESVAEEKIVVDEDSLQDKSLWEPLGKS